MLWWSNCYCLVMFICVIACRGWADKNARLKLWCFWSAECGYEVPVMILVFLHYYWCVLRMGRKAIGPVCCVINVKEPSALIEKRRGSPRCCWFDWQNIAPQLLVNHYMVLCKRSRSHNSNIVPHTLQENTELWSTLSVNEWWIWSL